MYHIIKADRSTEPFSDEKVINSIRRARVPRSLQAEVLTHIKSKLYDGISSAEIYQHILEFLNAAGHPYVKSSYSLKEAIMMLGPTGYPFEDFIAKILETQGYKTKVRQILSGRCISHEIDVVEEKDGRTAIIEAKFHNSPGSRSEVQTALYTHARFEDIKIRNNVHEVWLITNTKTTTDANTYAKCCGLKVISWSYPEGGSLRDLIERTRLHPVTMLTSLAHSQKATLLDNHIILCKDIKDNPTVLDLLYLSKLDRDKVLTEVNFICQTETYPNLHTGLKPGEIRVKESPLPELNS